MRLREHALGGGLHRDRTPHRLRQALERGRACGHKTAKACKCAVCPDFENIPDVTIKVQAVRGLQSPRWDFFFFSMKKAQTPPHMIVGLLQDMRRKQAGHASAAQLARICSASTTHLLVLHDLGSRLVPWHARPGALF